MQCIAIANHKGGVGKTALAQNLGVLLANGGRRVLLIDLDPQASLTGAFGIEATDDNLAGVLGGADEGYLAIDEVIQNVGERLDLVPSDISLAAAELGMIGRVGRENLLKRNLHGLEGRYDVVLIDCPPSLAILTINGLNAADGVLVPTQPQATDLRGLRLFLDTLAKLRRGLDREDLDIVGIVPTFYDRRYTHHQDAIRAMERGGLKVLTPIGRTVKMAESMAGSQSLQDYERNNPQVEALQQLAEEISEWLRKNQN